MHGLWTDWQRNGQMDTRGRYHLGLKDGVWRSWNHRGVLAPSFAPSQRSAGILMMPSPHL